MATCPELLSRTEVCQQLNLDFVCTEENVVDLDMGDTVGSLYLSDESTAEDAKDLLCEKLLTLLPSLGAFHEFSIISNKNSLGVANGVSEKLHHKINGYLSLLGDSEMCDKESGGISFLVLDRSLDLASPLMHSFHYSPLLHDLLPVLADVYSPPKGAKVLLKEDSFYQEHKHLFFTEFKTALDAKYQGYVAEVKQDDEK